MAFSFKDLIDFNKIPIKIFLLFAIVTSILLFCPDNYLVVLKVKEFEKEYGKFYGIIFIVCISFLILSIIYYIIKKINLYFYRREASKDIRQSVKCLDENEQAVLREFTVMRRKTVSMPIDNPVVAGLLNKGILKNVSNIGYGLYLPTTLSKTADKYLKLMHVGIESEHTEEQINEVFENRPNWTDDRFYNKANN